MDKSQPLIASINIPTYTRPHSKFFAFNRLIGQIQDTVSNPDDIEINVKIDDGDTQAFDVMSTYAQTYSNFHFWSTPTLGYRGNSHYHDFLASKSQGEFILLSADDNLFETKGWDKLLYNYVDKTTWFLKPCHGQEAYTNGNLAPLMHHRLFELVGHTGPYPADWFWDNIQIWYPIQWPVPEIRILHSWTGFPEETPTMAEMGKENLVLDTNEVRRIIGLIDAERHKR